MNKTSCAVCSVLLMFGCAKAAEPAAPAEPAPSAPSAPAAPAAPPPPAAPAPEPAAAAAEPAAAGAAQPAAGVAVKDDGKPIVEAHITVSGSTMTYDVTKIAAAAGQRVHIVLENKVPGILGHNWALVRPGTEAAVAAAGLKAGAAAGYVAEGPDLLVHTELVPPGKTGELTFNAPAAGTYPYICTFPGHYMMMKGVLTVTP